MEGGDRPYSGTSKNIESYQQLQYERDRLAESLEFIGDKCDRQGLFLAGLADFIEEHYDKNNNFECVIRSEIKQFLTNEVEAMKQRVKKLREKSG